VRGGEGRSTCLPPRFDNPGYGLEWKMGRGEGGEGGRREGGRGGLEAPFVKSLIRHCSYRSCLKTDGLRPHH